MKASWVRIRGAELVAAAALGWALMAPASAATAKFDEIEESLDLPEWTEFDTEELGAPDRPVNLGGGLWPSEEWPLQNVPPPKFVIGETIPGPVDPRRIPEEAEAVFFGERPESYLVDPQNLIEESRRDSLARFLDYHAEDSPTAVYVLALRGGQRVPEDVSTADLWQRWFENGRGVIVFYPVGNPRAAAAEFGPAVTEEAGRAGLRMLLDRAVIDSLRSARPEEQLERFLVELSVRLHRFEEDLIDSRRLAAAEAEAANQAASGWTVEPGVLILAGGGIAAFALAFGWAGMSWWLARRRYLFPDFEVPARLGADHAGGADAVVCFGAPPEPEA